MIFSPLGSLASPRGETNDGGAFAQCSLINELVRVMTLLLWTLVQISNAKPLPVQSSNKKAKFLNWQERRKLEIERKQQEEDEQTLAKIEAPIPESNIGFKLLKRMGYTPGSALGKEGSGKAEPVGLEIRRSRAGIGREDPLKENKKQEEIRSEKRRRKEESLMEEFGSRQKTQWRSRRIFVNFQKAKAALDQLENKEFLEPEKNEDEEEGEQDEEEEEEVTEEVCSLTSYSRIQILFKSQFHSIHLNGFGLFIMFPRNGETNCFNGVRFQFKTLLCCFCILGSMAVKSR